ncbi:hypothetical protein [Bacillus cereus]|uniref:Phosphoribosylglycinamide formyltransferase n=1 Tax=Bacillus cereus VD184 TaxID=1053242 RepID=A0A9W5VVL5_BACCE|nr:hypothetical protein [Bacillus cereus]EOQ22601.1 hypothetical protein IKC_06365 [Bacillus cereus VD184]
MDNIREQIKILLIKKGYTMTSLIDALNKKHNRNDSVPNLSAKLSRNTLKYREAQEIADILGYKIEWVPDSKGDSN